MWIAEQEVVCIKSDAQYVTESTEDKPGGHCQKV